MPPNWMPVVVSLVVFFLVVYLIARYQVGHEAAARTLPFLAAIVVFAIAIGLVFRALPGSWGEKAWIGLTWVFPLWLIWLLLTRGNRQKKAGAVLVDLGRDRAGKISGIIGLIGVLVGLSSVLMSFLDNMSQSSGVLRFSGETFAQVSEDIFYLSLAGYLLYLWYEGRQLREGGIVFAGAFFGWHKIHDHEWKGEILSLGLKRRWPFSLWPVPLRISSDQKEAVDQILRDRLQTGEKVKCLTPPTSNA